MDTTNNKPEEAIKKPHIHVFHRINDEKKEVKPWIKVIHRMNDEEKKMRPIDVSSSPVSLPSEVPPSSVSTPMEAYSSFSPYNYPLMPPNQCSPFQFSEDYAVPIDYFNSFRVGLTDSSKQEINKVYALNKIGRINTANIHRMELELMIMKHNVENMIAQSSMIAPPPTPIIPGLEQLPMLVASIIKNFGILKEESDINIGNVEFYCYDRKKHRHMKISEQAIKTLIRNKLTYEYMQYVNQVPDSDIERLIRNGIYGIPFISDVNSCVLPSTAVRFNNGVYDITQDTFIATTPENSMTLFNRFSIPSELNTYTKNPDAFDAMLSDMFNNDENLITLAYQIIGSILSNHPTFKKIFLLQGVSNGGKSRLINIITSLLDKADVEPIWSYADITDDKLRKKLDSLKLIYMYEGEKKALASKQLSHLKVFADGTEGIYKFMFATNYKVITDSEGNVSRAIANRMLVLPFSKPMDNTDERVKNFEAQYLEIEKSDIIIKALRAFKQVLNTGSFIVNPQLNAIIDDNIGDSDSGTGNNQLVAEKCYQQISSCDEPTVGLSTDELMALINEESPDTIKTANFLGKIMKLLGDRVDSERRNNKTYYFIPSK